MKEYQGPRMEFDGFDMLLIVQAVGHIQKSKLWEDTGLKREVYYLVGSLETFVLKNLESLDIH